jgi:hypothetical protein
MQSEWFLLSKYIIGAQTFPTKMVCNTEMELIDIFNIILLKIDLKKVTSLPESYYDRFRQELGININTSLSGPRIGQWIGNFPVGLILSPNPSIALPREFSLLDARWKTLKDSDNHWF